jgi:uncharacterized protein YjbI with pentapeptide repeats
MLPRWPAERQETQHKEAGPMASGNARRTGLGLAGALLAVMLPAQAVQAASCNDDPEPGIDWTDCRKRNLILSGSDLSGAKLVEADFTSTDLRSTTLEKADFSKATLLRASLSGSKAAGANFERAVGFRTDFVETDLAGANFNKSEMQRADFSGAVLTGVDFEKSELGRARFGKADINGTNFRFSNLARADFRESVFATPIDFGGSYLYLTRFDGVDLSNATGIEQWQIDLACGDANTKLPASLARPPKWPCAEE